MAASPLPSRGAQKYVKKGENPNIPYPQCEREAYNNDGPRNAKNGVLAGKSRVGNGQKVSPVRAQHTNTPPYFFLGGGTWGTRSSDLGPPPWVSRSIYKKKILQDPGPSPHKEYTKKFGPPPPQPPPSAAKKGVPRWGGGGGRGVIIKKINRWIILFPKMMIVQGVRHAIPYPRVHNANDLKKGGYMVPAPVLALTTSLQGDFGKFSADACQLGNHLTGVVRSKPQRPGNRGKRHIPPISGLFGAIRVPYLKGLNRLFHPL